MSMPTIPLAQSRKVARMGDLAQIRAMGGEHRQRQAAWEYKSLDHIFNAHGQAGILAALDADTPEQAAQWIATPRGGTLAYRQERGLRLWLGVGMEALWEALCAQGVRWEVGVGNPSDHVRRCALGLAGVSSRTLKNVFDHHGRPDGIDLLWAGSQPSSITWDHAVEALGLAYFIHTSQPLETTGGETIPATILHHLIKNACLMGRGRMEALVHQMEGQGDIFEQMKQHRSTLALACLMGARTTLLRRIKAWEAGAVPAPPGGRCLLSMGLLSHEWQNRSWEQRWPCLRLLGASNPAALERAIRQPDVIEGLLSCAQSGYAEHAFKVVAAAASVGININHLRDAHGHSLVAALQARQEQRHASIISLSQHLHLSEETPSSLPAKRRVRL